MGMDKESNESYLTKDFIILWQGHFVSAIGTVVYGIALGFWVLAETGSTAMMGLVSAAVVLPKLFIGPIAGVIVDEHNKKWILVAADVISGVTILGIALLALFGILQVWMAIVAGILIGTAEAFFKPSVQSSIPLIVSKEQLGKANSLYSAAFSSSNLIGRSIVGLLYQLIGAPLIFLGNGISYLFSAISELFLKPLPGEKTRTAEETYWQKIKKGGEQVLKTSGLLQIFIIIAFLNFFGYMVVTLYIPFFAQSSELGVINYGIVMACSTAGTLFGQLIFSKIEIKENHRDKYFCFAGVLSNLFIVFFPFFQSMPILIILIFLSGLISTPINIVLITSMQLSVPSKFLGRVFSLVGMVGGFLVPLAMVTAGIIAEIIDAQIIISICASALVILFGGSFFSQSLRTFLNNG